MDKEPKGDPVSAVPDLPKEPADPSQVAFDELIATVRAYVDDEAGVALIERAYHYAKNKHGDQKRRSGEPYITHPIAVAQILTHLKVDPPTIVSALLHDVVEDTETPLKEIKAEFGEVIAQLVDGLTKIRKIKFRSTQEKMAENFRKMILAMAKDLRVIIVKLADRLHNMRTLGALPPEKRHRIAMETLDIYAPLANRLGIHGIKSELEDLCLKETKYETYREIADKVAGKKKERQNYIAEVRSILENELKRYGFETVKVYGRPKHFYSIYKKMIDRRISFEDIHDLFAFRIIVGSVKECYEALGVIHAMWKPMPGRFKDYIAMPKANLYQSLHTTVIRPNGSPAEIQIRTEEMHKVCEFGVAAHWSYKEKESDVKNADFERFGWLRQMMELQDDVKDPDEFLDAVKVDLFEEEIFVFTPKGDVIQLAHGSTPLDLAFAIHTDLGLTTVAAKVNSRITPLRSKLHSGDIVEIVTSANQKPSKDWLNFVITSKARNKIRSYLRSEQRTKSHKMGKEILTYELAQHGQDLDKLVNAKKVNLLVKTAKESSLDDLYVALGYGRVSARDIVERVFPAEDADAIQLEKLNEPHPTTKKSKVKGSGILVSGLDNVLVNFSKCCNPIPGERIMGFITRGRGVSVHRIGCARAHDLDPARRIEVSWENLGETKDSVLFTVCLRVITHDRQGILAEITSAISASGANISKAQVNVAPDMRGILEFEVTLRNLDHLQEVARKIEGIQDVMNVERHSIISNNRTFSRGR